MARLIISLFLLANAWSNLAGAVEAFAHDNEGGHIAHEVHGGAADHDEHDLNDEHTDDHNDDHNEDHAHHHCAHNLIGMTSAVPAVSRINLSIRPNTHLTNPHHPGVRERLLRPPRS